MDTQTIKEVHANVVLMLVHRLRRWPNIKTLVCCVHVPCVLAPVVDVLTAHHLPCLQVYSAYTHVQVSSLAVGDIPGD